MNNMTFLWNFGPVHRVIFKKCRGCLVTFYNHEKSFVIPLSLTLTTVQRAICNKCGGGGLVVAHLSVFSSLSVWSELYPREHPCISRGSRINFLLLLLCSPSKRRASHDWGRDIERGGGKRPIYGGCGDVIQKLHKGIWIKNLPAVRQLWKMLTGCEVKGINSWHA